ncbi:MAG: Dynamin family protein, partial [Candidatus Neomarinimicrobiota bacterium]
VLAEAIPGFFEHHLGLLASEFGERVEAVLEPHRERVRELIETLRQTAADVFDVEYHPPASQNTFRFENEPYWVTHQWRSTVNPIPPQWIDYLLPPVWKQKRRQRRLEEEIRRLVVRNVENLRWTTLQNLQGALRRFRNRLAESFEESAATTRQAIQSALVLRQERAEITRTRMETLEAAAAQVEQMQAQVRSPGRTS